MDKNDDLRFQQIRLVPDIDFSDSDQVDTLFAENEDQLFSGTEKMEGNYVAEVFNNLVAKKGNGFKAAVFKYNIGLTSPNRYKDIQSSTDVVDPTLAVLFRIFDKYPNLCPDFPETPIQELMELGPFDSARQLSFLLGRDQVSVSRYLSSAKKSPSSSTKMLTYILSLFIRAGRLEEFKSIVIDEGATRGVKDVTVSGWPKKEKPVEKATQTSAALKKQATKLLNEHKELPASAENDKKIARYQEMIDVCLEFNGLMHSKQAELEKMEEQKVKVGIEGLPAPIKNKAKQAIKELEESLQYINEKSKKVGAQITKMQKEIA